MLKRLIENFRKGIDRIKWFSNVFSERLKIEIAVIKLLHQSEEMEKKREEMYKAIGRRVYELKGHYDKNILRDKAVVETIGGIEKIIKDIEELKQKVSDISTVGV